MLEAGLVALHSGVVVGGWSDHVEHSYEADLRMGRDDALRVPDPHVTQHVVDNVGGLTVVGVCGELALILVTVQVQVHEQQLGERRHEGRHPGDTEHVAEEFAIGVHEPPDVRVQIRGTRLTAALRHVA